MSPQKPTTPPASPPRLAKGLLRDDPAKLKDKKDARQHPQIAVRLMKGHGTVNGKKLTGLRGSADLSPYEPPRFDQGPTGSCTAHSSSGAIFAALAAAKQRLGFVPSPRQIYAASRALERQPDLSGKVSPLADTGAQLADVATALGRYGVAPMGEKVDGRNSDVDTLNIGVEPDVMALEQAGLTLITGEYLIDPKDPQVSDLVAASLEAGLPVWVGFFCDGAFENLSPGQVAQAPNESDPNGGGHAVYLSGYTKTPQGRVPHRYSGPRVFTLTNSWGDGWCDGGKCLVSEAWLRACWSLYPMAVTVAQKEQVDE